jgi:hypothetical protein
MGLSPFTTAVFLMAKSFWASRRNIILSFRGVSVCEREWFVCTKVLWNNCFFRDICAGHSSMIEELWAGHREGSILALMPLNWNKSVTKSKVYSLMCCWLYIISVVHCFILQEIGVCFAPKRSASEYHKLPKKYGHFWHIINPAPLVKRVTTCQSVQIYLAVTVPTPYFNPRLLISINKFSVLGIRVYTTTYGLYEVFFPIRVCHYS